MISLQVNNFNQWREQTRELLRRGLRPEQLHWQSGEQALLDLAAPLPLETLPIVCQRPTLPAAFFDLARDAACYRDEQRWPLLYRYAWRLLFENRQLMEMAADPDLTCLRDMQKAVSRDRHKMKAFVRFHSVPDDNDEAEVFVAWFEPSHLIVESVAPFFAKRFTTMHWSILTPDLCAHWDRRSLYFTAGRPRPKQGEDALCELWRQYYAHIFNPARVKLKAMQAEMPKKYWVNLPEAPLIADLTRSAGARCDAMLAADGRPPWKKTQKSQQVQAQQHALRRRNREQKR